MGNIYLSKYYLLWMVSQKIKKWQNGKLAIMTILLLAIAIIFFSSMYLIQHLKKDHIPQVSMSETQKIRDPFFREFSQVRDDNEIIHKILSAYEHVEIKKLSATTNYKSDKKSLYGSTETSIYFETVANQAQKIAASILNISPLIILNKIYFIRANNKIDNNPIVNVKMDLTLITNKSFKV